MENQPVFAPMLGIGQGVTDVSFYTHAFGAVELRRFSNDDGSIHVAEFAIGSTVFHLHEETPHSSLFSPAKYKGVTAVIEMWVDDPDAAVEKAVAAGAKIRSPVQDYDYGYRQGEIVDPFGHHWQIEKRVIAI